MYISYVDLQYHQISIGAANAIIKFKNHAYYATFSNFFYVFYIFTCWLASLLWRTYNYFGHTVNDKLHDDAHS